MKAVTSAKTLLAMLGLLCLGTLAQAAPLSNTDKAEALAQFSAFQTALKNKDLNALYPKISVDLYRESYGIKEANAKYLTAQLVSKYKLPVLEDLAKLRVFKPNQQTLGFTTYKGSDRYCSIQTRQAFVSKGGKGLLLDGEVSAIDGIQLIYSTFPGKQTKGDAADGCAMYMVYYFEFKNHQLSLVRQNQYP